MITEELNDVLVERFVERTNKANEYYLKNIGEMLKKIKNLTPTEAQQLVQMLKYGGDYEEIVKKIAKYTSTNIDEVNTLFENYAKKDQQFYEKFYRYRNIPFVEYAKNEALIRQTQALSRIAQTEMFNFSRTNVLGYTINGKFFNLRETYNELLDTALLNVGQGKETFDSAMTNIIKQIGGSGLKTLNYESGRNVRLDSAVRMHLKGRLRELHNENQQIFGEEFGADGVEISVHSNPAPDHAEVQGRQFSTKKPNNIELSEWEKLQNGLDAKDYKGNTYSLDHDNKNGYRPISEMNCYHYVFSIVLGVSRPEYTDEQLKGIIDDNKKGFELDGKHYTNYEGTQMQRALERKIREQKDIQILAKESDNKELIGKSQQNITTLTKKYKELSNVSGLPTKMQRMKISGYRRTKINNYKEIEYARKNNKIWHSTESVEDIIRSNKIETPSISVGRKINDEVRYGTQFIEFKPEILENVDKGTKLYLGDGGNKFTKSPKKVNSLMKILKDDPEIYNEIKFNNDLEALKYIKKVHIRQDEPKEVITLLEENKIDYEIYNDYRIRPAKRKK